MEKQEMKITPQDIIDKEFKVKFRGFDMAEVDTFLEEVAEKFFKLMEENTLLHEKVLALQRDLEAAGSFTPQGQAEVPAELGNTLEDLKQDTAAISAELVSLKQERQTLDFLKDGLKKVIATLGEPGAAGMSQAQVEFPADLADTLEELKQGAAAVAADLAALQEERLAFDSLKKNLEEVIGSAKEAASTMASRQGQVEIPGNLGKTLEEFKRGTETMGAELAALKKEISPLANIRAEIKGELQEQLTSRFAELDAKLSTAGEKAGDEAPKLAAVSPAPVKKEKLIAARIEEEPEGLAEDSRLPDYEELDEGSGDGALEFLSEDDILDVDKLRGIFQSVLDEGISDAPESRDGDEATADLLFLEEDFIADDHEPEVSFSLDEKETEEKPKLGNT